jgi:hypothetical protein
MRNLIILVAALAILAPTGAMAKSRDGTKSYAAQAPARYEGMPRTCWPDGSRHGSYYCCVARGNLISKDRQYKQNRSTWCKFNSTN